MFFALAERHRRIEAAKEEGLKQGRKEARQEARKEAGEMLMVLNAVARTNPESLPSLLEEYQAKLQNGAANE